jgi:hypothetical protein
MHSLRNAKCIMENWPCLITSTIVATSMQTKAYNVVLTRTLASFQATIYPQVQFHIQFSFYTRRLQNIVNLDLNSQMSTSIMISVFYSLVSFSSLSLIIMIKTPSSNYVFPLHSIYFLLLFFFKV